MTSSMITDDIAVQVCVDTSIVFCEIVWVSTEINIGVIIDDAVWSME